MSENQAVGATLMVRPGNCVLKVRYGRQGTSALKDVGAFSNATKTRLMPIGILPHPRHGCCCTSSRYGSRLPRPFCNTRNAIDFNSRLGRSYSTLFKTMFPRPNKNGAVLAPVALPGVNIR